MRRLELLLALLLCAGVALAADKTPKPARGALSEAGRENVMLTEAYLSAGRLDAAEDRAKAALASDPGAALAHANMALVHAKRKHDDQAQGEFQRALKLAPADGAVLNAYGAWLCGRGNRAEADAAFRGALADTAYAETLQTLVNAGHCALLASEWNKADDYLRRAVAIAPRSRPVLLMLAETQLRLGRALEARAFVQRSDALGSDAQTLALAARVEDAAGDLAAATRYRNRLRQEFPNLAPTGEGARKP